MSTAHFYYPGMGDEFDEEELGLREADRWPDWVAQANAPGALRDALERHGLLALASHITEGMPEEDVDWTTPGELIAAARRAGELVSAGRVDAAPLLAGFTGEDFHTDGFLQHLDDLVRAAEYASARGHARITTCVNF